jgi:hypothetical protein
MDADAPLKQQNIPGEMIVGWDDIRRLDDEENWSERTRIISKQDHQFYLNCATKFVSELIDKVSSRSFGGTTNADHESTDYGIHGVTDDNEGMEGAYPPQSEEYQYMNEFSDADFQTHAAAQFDIDYLEKLSSHNHPSIPSALTRESLYVKFDPLVGPMSTNKQLTAISHSIPQSGDNLLMLNTPPPVATPISHTKTAAPLSSSSATHNLIGDSPGIVKSLQQTPNSIHGGSPVPRTLLDSSPSTMSPGNYQLMSNHAIQIPRTSLEGNTELIKVLKYSDADIQQVILQVRQECQIEFENQLVIVKEEYSEEIHKLQKKMERLVKELQNLRTNNALQTTNSAKFDEEIARLRDLCVEHEVSENKCLDMYEKLKEESREIEKQRDQALSDFNSLEKSFAEFHQRHIKARESVATLQKTEASLQQYISELETKLDSIENLNQQLQQDTQVKIQEYVML